MIPGEILAGEGDHVLNEGQPVTVLDVANGGDRPLQVGSHYHFAETNAGLVFDREAARGLRLDIPAGTAVRFEPGQTRSVSLVPFRGGRAVIGFRGLVMGGLDTAEQRWMGRRYGVYMFIWGCRSPLSEALRQGESRRCWSLHRHCTNERGGEQPPSE